jgi:L-malate glycosyltransferase
MRILTVNYEYPPLGGGGGVACEQVAAELVALGHEVDVLTSLGPGARKEENRSGVRITRVDVWGRAKKETASFLSMFTFVVSATSVGKRMVRDRGYDIVHTHFAVPSGPAGARIARAGRVPMVLSIHGGDLYDPSKWTSPHRFWPAGRVVRKVLRKADLVLAQSTNTAENARTHHRFEGRIEIVPLGLPPVEFDPATRSELGLDQDDFVLVTVGRLVKRKGLTYLLDAIAGVDSDKTRLVICGDGPERTNLEDQARALGISNRVVFTGYVDEEQKFQILSLADLFVMASLHEGFGIVFLEAMSQGLPIVTANVGGQTDFLEQDENALLVSPANCQQLSSAIGRLAGDAGLREHMRLQNLGKVKQFAIRKIAERHVELFEEVVAQMNREPRQATGTASAPKEIGQ